MCGIAGIAARDPRRDPIGGYALQRMTDVIEHRGPDDQGHHREAGVALGMRRLSIIDLETGAQPLANENEQVWTVFNGEIFNFHELRADLRARGHRFSTEGDTETIVHLYEEHGPGFARFLRGMFGIAVWDRPRRRLTLVRDRLGVKPLYLHEGPEGLAFASEIKSLIAGGLVEPRLDPIAAELLMAHGFVPGPRTLFEGVTKLAPGEVLVWEDGKVVSVEPYWTAPARERASGPRSWEDDQEELMALLRESVRARMISDVPLGVMLSGGLDSSLLAALMAEQASGPIKTFSIGFAEDAAADELDDAHRVAQRLGTEHHALKTSAVDHPELLDEAIWHMEDPVADVSCIGFLLLSRLARETVTVALSGQGADELLGGYRKHQFAMAANMVQRAPGFTGRGLALAAGRMTPGSSGRRALEALSTPDPVARLLAMSRVVQPEDRARLFEPAFLVPDAEREIAEPLRRLAEPVLGESPLRQTLHIDLGLGLVDNMLLYFDKISMAASLEVRVPFMDHDVVEFCMRLPDDRRVAGVRGRKELLKRASRGLVDDSIIDKKKRGFFHSALGAWLKVNGDGVVRESLLDERARARGLFREEPVRAMVAAVGEEGKKTDQRLFSLLLLERWQRMWTDPDSAGRRLYADATAAAAA